MTETITSIQTIPNIGEIQKIIGSAPATLEANIKSKINAIKAADELILLHTNFGMTEKLNADMAIYTDKAKKTITALNEKRKPFTQMMTELSKQFTGCETSIKGKVDELQKLRDDYVAMLMRQKQEAERIAAQKLAREKEVVDVRAKIKTAISVAFYNMITAKKTKVNEIFDAVTLNTYEATQQMLSTRISLFSPAQLAALNIVLPATTLPAADVLNLKQEVLEDDALRLHYASEYQSAMTVFQKDTIDRLPSKRQQLEEMAKATEKQKAKLLEDEAKRKKEVADQLIKEQEAANARMEVTVATQAAAEASQAVFGAMFSSGNNGEAPRVKETTEIIVKEVSGYALIFQFWLENEGKGLEVDKIEKKTIGQMKKYCEDYATKTGEVIVSNLIEYKDKYKAK
jgi:hypothetical protein